MSECPLWTCCAAGSYERRGVGVRLSRSERTETAKLGKSVNPTFHPWERCIDAFGCPCDCYNCLPDLRCATHTTHNHIRVDCTVPGSIQIRGPDGAHTPQKSIRTRRSRGPEAQMGQVIQRASWTSSSRSPYGLGDPEIQKSSWIRRHRNPHGPWDPGCPKVHMDQEIKESKRTRRSGSPSGPGDPETQNSIGPHGPRDPGVQEDQGI